MTVSIPFNGSTYYIPSPGQNPPWATGTVNINKYLTDIATGTLQYSLFAGVPVGKVLASNGTGGVQFISAPSPTFPIEAANGLVSAPSYSFAASSNTGLYSPATHQLALATNGVNALTIDAAGNVAMEGNLSAVGSFSCSGDTDTGTLTVSGATTLSNTLSVALNTTLSSAVTVGTTLSVTGATTLSGGLTVTGNETVNGTLSISNGANNTQLTQTVSSASYANSLHLNRGAGNDTYVGLTNAGTFDINTSEGVPVRIVTAAGEALRVTTSNQLAIGTTSASHTLEVNGTFNVSGAATAPTASPGDNSTNIATTAFVALNASPTGATFMFPISTPPTGFLECNGASLSTTTYSRLFAVLGYLYGGSGESFNLPDMPGMFMRGWDDSRGVDSGRAIGTYQADIFAQHTHDVNDPSHTHEIPVVNSSHGGSVAGEAIYQYSGPGEVNYATTGITINTTGGTETRPKNVAMMFIMKY